MLKGNLIAPRNFLFFAVVLIASFYFGVRNYLLFHSGVQIFTSIIAFNILIIAINTFAISKNNFFMFLGIGYGFVGVFDLLHTITFEGMQITRFEDVNISLQAAIVAMFIESVTLLYSYRLLKNRHKSFRPVLIALVATLMAISILFAIFYNNIFPDVVNELYKSTNFKTVILYVILTIFIISLYLFHSIRKNVDRDLALYLQHAIIAKMISLIIFIFYISNVYLSILLHVSKLMAFYFIYKAIIKIGLKEPYKLLYNELSETNEKLKEENIKRKEFEEALLNNEECYQLLIHNSKDIIIVHSENKIQFANDRVLNLLDIDFLEELIGKPIDEFVAEDDLENVYDKIRLVYESKKYVPFFEMKLKSKDGGCIYVEAAGVYTVYNGKPSVVAIVRDIRFKKQVEDLKKDVVISNKLLTESREYNKLITEFMSNISHELRTPLNVILSAVQVMAISDLEANLEVKEKYLSIVKQNSYRLLRLVNNLIEISRIDSGYIKLDLQKHNIINAIEDITTSVSEYITNKGLNLIFDTNIEERYIYCDYDKIERIMLNLLSNAVKFTRSGDSIFVNVISEEKLLTISVKDTGIGIPEDKLDTIFERFAQVDKSFTRQHEGSGIGLALVKSLVDMHSGSIEVISKLGEGSEFIIVIPISEVGEVIVEDEISHVSSGDTVKIEFADIYD
jgi:PAS domain S-box-containing protein